MKTCLLATLLAMILAVGVLYVPFPVSVDPVNSVVLVYNAGGHGSGAIIDTDCVLTARHVADNPNLTVRTSDGDEYQVVRVMKDPDSDLARLYVDGVFDERPLILDRTPLCAEDEVVVIGTPFDLSMLGTILHGRVVKVDVTIPDYGYAIPLVNADILDVHGGPGCSGGPVMDREGRIRAVFLSSNGVLCGAVPVEELDEP